MRPCMRPGMTKALTVSTLAALVLVGCSRTSDVQPTTVKPLTTAPTAAQEPVPVNLEFEGDAATSALRNYLREQAVAVNAGSADREQVPAFLATLTPAAQDWALPLLAENLGDRMPGPYPSGVLASERVGAERVELQVCLQDRGWQVDRTTGETLNAANYSTAQAVVLRVEDRWLVDDLVADGGQCTAADVVEERF